MSFSVTHSFRPVKLQKEDYRKRLDQQLGIFLREAARAWLRTWLEQSVPPVETGMARAALRPLGKFLRVAIPISPTRKPYYSKLEGARQSIGSGEKKQRFKIKDDKSNPLKFIYSFSWSTTILHYYLAQYYNGSSPTGEEIIPQADEAFEQYLLARLEKDVPKIKDYIRHG